MASPFTTAQFQANIREGMQLMQEIDDLKVKAAVHREVVITSREEALKQRTIAANESVRLVQARSDAAHARTEVNQATAAIINAKETVATARADIKASEASLAALGTKRNLAAELLAKKKAAAQKV